MSEKADRKPLGTADAVGLIVGIIIGAGIFETPAKVFAAVSSPAAGIWLWMLGAIPALCGALCYAELAAAYPTDAGEAEYFTRGFGNFVGWYFTWVQLVCFRTAAAIVSIAYIFAKNAQAIWPQSVGLYVVAAIVVLTTINALGIRPGKWTQNTLAVIKVIGLFGLIVVGFLLETQPNDEANRAAADQTALALAAVMIMYAYSGWHEAAYIVGDMRTPSRSLPKAMLIGVGLVTAIYLAVNLAALHGLGFNRLRVESRFGSEIFQRAGLSATIFAALVVLVTLGSTNGTILSGSRLFGTVGQWQLGYGWLGRWRTRRDAPVAALITQAAICLAFVTAIEYRDTWSHWFGVNDKKTAADGFDLIVAATSPVLWLVFLGAGLALVTLRFREPDRPRPFQVPLYPLVPVIYIAGCLFMLYESILYALEQRGPELWLTLILLLAGLPYWWFAGRDANAKRP